MVNGLNLSILSCFFKSSLLYIRVLLLESCFLLGFLFFFIVITDDPAISEMASGGNSIAKSVLSLKDCIQTATRSSEALKALENQLKIAELGIKDVDAYFWPKASASIDYFLDNNNDYSVLNKNRFIPKLVLSQNVMITGEAAVKMWESYLALYQTRINLGRGESELGAELTQKYF